MRAGLLRQRLQELGGEREQHAEATRDLEQRTGDLLRQAQRHPEVSMSEAARLLGFKRRATAYGYLERGKHG